MVTGLELFADYFKGYEKNYVIIGGVACAIHEENYFQTPRATKDIDLILVLEELNPEFALHFWEFIRKGGYTSRQKAENKRELYRFTKPTKTGYPVQIELFSKDVGFKKYAPELPITPIHISEEISSLSAILMDTDYYQFTMTNSDVVNNLHIANRETLVCLKAKAYNDLSDRKSQGEPVDSRDIKKHKNDIFRLGVTFYESDRFGLPESMLKDWQEFLNRMGDNLPNADMFKRAGMEGVDSKGVLHLLKELFVRTNT